METIVCIECPNGCELHCDMTETGFSCTGHHCKRGAAYGEAELTHPVRTLTTTVHTAFPDVPVISVRTDGAIPKEKILDAVRVLAGITVNTPVQIGSVIYENILDTGVNVICTTDRLRTPMPSYAFT